MPCGGSPSRIHFVRRAAHKAFTQFHQLSLSFRDLHPVRVIFLVRLYGLFKPHPGPASLTGLWPWGRTFLRRIRRCDPPREKLVIVWTCKCPNHLSLCCWMLNQFSDLGANTGTNLLSLRFVNNFSRLKHGISQISHYSFERPGLRQGLDHWQYVSVEIKEDGLNWSVSWSVDHLIRFGLILGPGCQQDELVAFALSFQFSVKSSIFGKVTCEELIHLLEFDTVADKCSVLRCLASCKLILSVWYWLLSETKSTRHCT